MATMRSDTELDGVLTSPIGTTTLGDLHHSLAASAESFWTNNAVAQAAFAAGDNILTPEGIDNLLGFKINATNGNLIESEIAARVRIDYRVSFKSPDNGLYDFSVGIGPVGDPLNPVAKARSHSTVHVSTGTANDDIAVTGWIILALNVGETIALMCNGPDGTQITIRYASLEISRAYQPPA